jgi:hypothetical protein
MFVPCRNLAEVPALVQAPVLVAGLGYSTLHNTEVYDMTATEEVGNYNYHNFPLFQLKQLKRTETCQFILSLCIMEELEQQQKHRFKEHKTQVSLNMVSFQRLESTKLHSLPLLAQDSGK